MKNLFFSLFVQKVLLHADMPVLSNALGMRDGNSKVFWMRKNNNDIYEATFGKQFFYPEYTRGKIILEEDIDYFGSIFKWSDLCLGDHFLLYLLQLYKSGRYEKEINEPLDDYVRKNFRYCASLLLHHYRHRQLEILAPMAKLRKFLRNFFKASPIEKGESSFARNLASVASYYGGKSFGLIMGAHSSLQEISTVPIIQAFNKRGISIVYARPGNRDRLEKTSWGHFLDFKLPAAEEVLRNKNVRERLKTDRKKLETRIKHSSIDKIYKKFMLKRLDEGLKQYYIIRAGLEELVRELKFSFIFALPDKRDIQRTLLMLLRKANIPSFTYDPMFNTSETVVQWFYLSDWVLMSNKKWARMLDEKGFPISRTHVVGSTLADLCFERNGQNKKPDDVLNIVLMTKSAHRSMSNYPVLNALLETMENSKKDYRIFIRPHPVDMSSYEEYINKYGDKIILTSKDLSLHECLQGKDITVVCGISNVILECLPSKKPIIVIDLTDNTDKMFFARQDVKDMIPYFEDLDSFKKYLSEVLKTGSFMEYDIPQSFIDDYYCNLDGSTAERIVDFVLSKVNNTALSHN